MKHGETFYVLLDYRGTDVRRTGLVLSLVYLLFFGFGLLGQCTVFLGNRIISRIFISNRHIGKFKIEWPRRHFPQTSPSYNTINVTVVNIPTIWIFSLKNLQDVAWSLNIRDAFLNFEILMCYSWTIAKWAKL